MGFYRTAPNYSTSGVPISLCPRPGVYVNPHLTLYGWGKVGEGRSLRGEERRGGEGGRGRGPYNN